MSTFVDYIITNAAGLTADSFDGLADHLSGAEELTSDSIQELLDSFFAEAEPLVAAPKKAVATAKGKGKGKGKVASTGEVVLVSDCPKAKSGTQYALFGDTASIKDHLMDLNNYVGYKDIVKYNASLHFGPGWAVMDASRVSEVTDKLDEIGKPYTTLTAAEYAEQVGQEAVEPAAPKGKVAKGKVAAKGKAPVGKGKVAAKGKAPVGKGKVAAKGKAPVGKGKVAPKGKAPAPKGKAGPPKVAPRPEAITSNDWNNFEDPETGIVFLKMPVGAGGRQISVAVGTQNHEAEYTDEGLASVLPLDDETIKVCKTKKYIHLSDAHMEILSEKDSELYGSLSQMRGDAADEEEAEEAEEEEIEEAEEEEIEEIEEEEE